MQYPSIFSDFLQKYLRSMVESFLSITSCLFINTPIYSTTLKYIIIQLYVTKYNWVNSAVKIESASLKNPTRYLKYKL